MSKTRSNEKKCREMVIIQPSMPFGGTEKVLINMLKVINYTQWNVDLFLKEKRGELLCEIPSKVHIFELPNLLSGKELLFYDIFHAKIADAVWLLCSYVIFKVSKSEKAALMLQKNFYPSKVVKKKYDVAISYQGAFEEGNSFLLKSFSAKRKYVWVHGEIRCNQFQMQKFKKIFCVSEGARKAFTLKYPSLQSKTDIFYNFIDKNEVIAKAEEPIEDMEEDTVSIVSVGRLSPEKGFQIIPDIAKLLCEDGFLFKWYIIGDGKLKDEIELACNKSNINCVILLGVRKNPYPYMKKCTIYVQPSFTEGFCTTTNEAKVLHKPVVTTDVPGMREQFSHGETGYIVERATPEELYRGIKYLLQHEEVRRKYAENLKIREKSEEYANLQQLHTLLE